MTAILDIIANLLGIVRNRQTFKNAADVKKAKVSQNEVNIQNQAELAVKNQKTEDVQKLLG